MGSPQKAVRHGSRGAGSSSLLTWSLAFSFLLVVRLSQDILYALGYLLGQSCLQIMGCRPSSSSVGAVAAESARVTKII